MAAIYARAVLDGRRTIESVPERWREAVEAIVAETLAEDIEQAEETVD